MIKLLTKPMSAREQLTFAGHKTEVLMGEEVLALLLEPEFQAGWDFLYAACPWGTVFQSRPFVATWYRSYQNEYLPILVKTEHNGKLTGLLTMALHTSGSNSFSVKNKSGRMVGAGHFEAGYQTWLAEVSNGETFITDALTALMKRFPMHDILFRYFPPHTPLGWIKSKKWSQCSVLQPYSRPLMNLKDPGISKLLRNSHYRNKLNRLKRLGEVHFEHIRDIESFAAILNELAAMYDFRQGALYNKNHFRDDPIKKKLILAEFEQKLLHVTVLKVNNKIMATVVARAGKDWMHLGGIICHSPLNSRFYSPGFLHFIMLAEQLIKEGFAYLDLTPGYESYKEQLANTHDNVYELAIAGSRAFWVKRQIRKHSQKSLVWLGIRPLTAEVNLKKRLYFLRKKGVMASMMEQLSRFRKKTKQKIYLIETGTLKPGAFVVIQKDNPSDLLDFEQERGVSLTRWEFLANALNRFERNEHCYTWVDDRRLLGCVWLPGSKTSSAGEDQSNVIVNDSTMLQGLYCHSAGRGRLQDFLTTVAAEAPVSCRSVFAMAEDVALCRDLEAAGFLPAEVE